VTFVETFATQQLLPPFSSPGVTVHAFMFRLDTGVVQAYCDRFFNLKKAWERPFHYVALPAPVGVLAITTYPRIGIKRPPGRQQTGPDGNPLEWENVSQNELYAAAPVWRYRVAAGGALVEPELQWVQPFLINDNGSSAFSGREVLGLETLWGGFHYPSVDDGSYAVDVTLPSWKVFNWDSPQEDLPFLKVRTGPPLGTEDALSLLAIDGKPPEALADMAALRAAMPDLAETLGQALPTDMTMVILKQFREAGDPSKAIYQALVNGSCRFSNIALDEMKVYAPESCLLEFTPGAMVDEMIATLLNLSEAEMQARMAHMALNEDVEHLKLEVHVALKFTADIEFDAIETIHRF
jgi:hypothetical protein